MKNIIKLLLLVTLLTITATKAVSTFAEEPEKVDTVSIPATQENEQENEMFQIKYTVKAGDSVWGIAEKTIREYNINNDTVADISNRIKFINNISENDILPIGKNIVISFYK